MEILNTYEITNNICTSGQPTKDQFIDIAANGYIAVINLAMPDHENSISDEGSIVSSLGMTYIHLPVPFDSPSADHLKQFSGYMRALQDYKVWVHCIVNARVSAFMYRYLQDEVGMSVADATTPVLIAWRPTMDKTWKNFIGEV